MKVSVIIPVYNDAERLLWCIDSIVNNTYADREIIVIDNVSNPPVTLNDPYPGQNIQLIREPVPGSYMARNTAIQQASGMLIGFTDADCLVDRFWIENAVEFMTRNPDIGLLGGRIQMFSDTGLHMNVIEQYELLFSLNQEKFIRYGKFAATANMWTWKAMFNKLGLFKSNLSSSGDKEWGNRVASAGYEVCYSEDVIVYHPARKTIREIGRKNARIGAGFYDNASGMVCKVRNLFKLAVICKHRVKDLFFVIKLPVLKKIRIFSVILIEFLYSLSGFMQRMLTSKTYR